MPSKKWLAVPVIFLCVGVLLLLFGYGNYKSTTDFLSKALHSTGTVTELHSHYDSHDSEYTYAPIVNFVDRKGNARTFSSSTYSNPASYAVGDRVDVLYDPLKPDSASINSWIDLYIGVLVLGIIGGLFVLIPGLILYFFYRRQKKILWLKENGKLVTAQVSSIVLNTNFKVNGRSPFVINAQWQDTATNTMCVFQSENIWFDPTQYVKGTVEVMVDPNDNKSYYMKTDFLPTSN